MDYRLESAVLYCLALDWPTEKERTDREQLQPAV